MRSKKRSSRGRRAAEGVGTAEEEQQGEKNNSEGRRAEGEDEQQWEGAGAAVGGSRISSGREQEQRNKTEKK